MRGLIMSKVVLIGLWSILSCSVQAEFRIWEDAKGNVFEGEFVAMSAGLVVLRNQAGKESSFNPEELCPSDLQYLDRVIPPALGLDVTRSTDNSGKVNNAEHVRCTAAIKQTDRRPYTGELTAVLVVMGEDIRTGGSAIASRKEHTFTLPEIRGESIEFASEQSLFYRRSRKTGRQYGGYVLVVWDRFGNAIAKKSNRASYEERAEKYATLGLKKQKITR